MRRSPPWTPDEDAYLIKTYRRRGGPAVARTLKRPLENVRYRVRALTQADPDALLDPTPHNHTAITDLERLIGIHRTEIRKRAARAGVLKAVGRKHYVPNKWAHALREQREAYREGSRAREAGYVPFATLAQRLGVGVETVRDGLLRGTRPHIFGDAILTRGMRAVWLVNPHSAAEIERRWNAERHKQRGLVPLKTLIMDLDGIATRTVVERLALKIEPNALVSSVGRGGLRRRYVRPETAERVRAHFHAIYPHQEAA